MLSLFSIERSPSVAAKKTIETTSPSTPGATDKLSQSKRENSGATGLSISLDSEAPPLWSTKVGRPRLFALHTNDCECCLRPLPMQQSIDEMEWERGIWGLSNAGKSERWYLNFFRQPRNTYRSHQGLIMLSSMQDRSNSKKWR
jgi:hypothetical protein